MTSSSRDGSSGYGHRPVVALLAAPETSASVLYGLYDVLLSVGSVYPDMTAGRPGDALLDVRIVAAKPEPFRCFGNIQLDPPVHRGEWQLPPGITQLRTPWQGWQSNPG